MTFHRYYQDELTYLREMGQKFSAHYPKLAPFLAIDSADPDVERLLEGFAFLTAKLRQKVDDEVPEFTSGLLSSIWPNFMRPVPGMSILAFTPIANSIRGKKTIARGSEVDSKLVEGIRCRFRTCYDVDVYPILVDAVEVRSLSGKSQIEITFKTDSGQPFSEIQLDTLRLFLHGDSRKTDSLYMNLLSHLDGIGLQCGSEELPQSLTGLDLHPIGFEDHESVIPSPDNVANFYRTLQEYHCFPDKFRFFEIRGFDPLRAKLLGNKLCITLYLDRELQPDCYPVKDSFRLFCTPIVNIFERDAQPLRLHPAKTEYLIKPSANDKQHYEVFTVEEMSGSIQGEVDRRKYRNYHDVNNVLQHIAGEDEGDYYQLRHVPSFVGRNVDIYASFVHAGKGYVRKADRPEVISVKLSCTNGNLNRHLYIGDIDQHSASTPEYVNFENITTVTQSYPAPIHLGVDWALIGAMSVKFRSITKLESFKQLVSLFDYPSYYSKQAHRIHQRRLEGIHAIKVSKVTRIKSQLPVRGMQVCFDVDSEKFTSEGEMYFFFTVVNHLLNATAQLNTFVETMVADRATGESHIWPWKH
ncbi:MAG: type VI secretion system baseplate subunit TssF [Gammaproteobacteria bacterium]|nr:type VI secretion system baseplate subunit TssF [Gammaproteobacteria bacterium]